VSEAAQRSARTATAPVLSLEDVSVRYKDGALGAVSITMSVEPGQLVAVFGPNGAGKTSTVRAASGFIRAEGVQVNGRITVAGEPVLGDEPHRVAARGLSFVPERNKLFPNLTVRENLESLGVQPPRARRQELEERILSLFPVLSDRRTEVAGRLSGGQQQMVAIGRALMMDPKVLIIDELTLGLHPSMHEPLYSSVRQIAEEGTAVVVVDESTGFALERADYCYLLTGGRVRDEGPPARFLGSELLAAGYVEATT